MIARLIIDMLKQVMTSINRLPTIAKTILLFGLLQLSACSTSHFPWVYRIDVEQGNIVDDDKLAEVELGMTRAQVKYLLGSPLIEDSFHPDRWDYFYSFRTGKGLYETRRVTLLFSGQTLTSVEKTPTTEIELDYW